jgi:hypothetical protein
MSTQEEPGPPAVADRGLPAPRRAPAGAIASGTTRSDARGERPFPLRYRLPGSEESFFASRIQLIMSRRRLPTSSMG